MSAITNTMKMGGSSMMNDILGVKSGGKRKRSKGRKKTMGGKKSRGSKKRARKSRKSRRKRH